MNNDSTANLKVVLSAEDEASSVFSNFSANAIKAGAALTAIGGAIDAGMYKIITAAEDGQTAIAQFNVTMADSKGNSESARDALLNAADAVTQLGFDHDQAAKLLATFFQQSHSVTEAVQMNNTAMDLARAKNIDYTTAAKLVQEVMNGNTGALTRYGIVIQKSKNGLVDLDQLQNQVKGSAQAFSQTAEGGSEAMAASWQLLQEKAGETLLPLLTSIATAITPIILSITKWIEQHQTLTRNILIAIGVFGVVLTVLGSVLALVGLVVAAFGSFAALIIGGVAVAIATFIALAAVLIANWKPVAEWFSTFLTNLKTGFDTVINYVIGLWDSLLKKIQAVADAIAQSQVGKVAGAVGGFASNVVAGAKSLVGRASGGPVNAGSTYLVGEQGPELFTPSSSGSIIPNGAGGAVAISVNINGGLITDDVARQIGNVIVQQFKRTARW